jgi:hypothetical protein
MRRGYRMEGEVRVDLRVHTINESISLSIGSDAS